MTREELITLLTDEAIEWREREAERERIFNVILHSWKKLLSNVERNCIRKAYRRLIETLEGKLNFKLPNREKEFEKDILQFLFGFPFSSIGDIKFTVGAIGFPNVGKSSLVNSLVHSHKRAAVSVTPGKTKHMQTLDIPGTQVTLCDCPGMKVFSPAYI